MRDVLVSRFGFDPRNVQVVLNPSHRQIERELADLADRVQHDDFVYVHYSGHGSTAADPNDPRGEDQTWVPSGAREGRLSGDDDWDVLDKEIFAWMEPLYRLTDDVVFVSDSCHSATVSRGVASGVRGANAARSADGKSKPHPLLGKFPATTMPANGLRIGAARDFESAVELDPRTNGGCTDTKQCYGVFTWNWAQALSENRPGETWAAVFDRAVARITTRAGLYQRPQIEGRADRVVFGGRYGAPSSSVAVAAVDKSRVTLDAGILSGVAIDSTYRSMAGSAAAPVATLRITDVSALRSTAILSTGAVHQGDLVAESRHAFAAPPIKLFVGAPRIPADRPLLQAVEQVMTQAVAASPQLFERVRGADSADWRLEVARPKTSISEPISDRRLPDHSKCGAACPPAQLWVVSRQGLLVQERMRFDPGAGAPEMQRVVESLQKLAWAHEVRALAAHGNSTPVAWTMTIWRPPVQDKRTCAEGAQPGSGWQSFGPFATNAASTPPRFNDCLSFEISNRSADHTWYGYVVAIGPRLNVTRTLPAPQEGADQARIAPGAAIRSDTSRLYRLNDAGVESLMLLASDGPVSTQALEREGLRGRQAQSQLDALLNAKAARRGEVEAVSDWGATATDFPIELPPSRPGTP